MQKYSYRVLYGNIAKRGIEVTREICFANYIDIISSNVSPGHAHMLISVPPHLSVSKVVQYIKGTSSIKLQGEFQELKKRYCGQHLWG
ncbi:MAG: IS200/IS605 family transposase [Alphaproteobacteria bacterium]|nr:IS200/IS605 family transposase [Alphaproteobacteria bacterium]